MVKILENPGKSQLRKALLQKPSPVTVIGAIFCGGKSSRMGIPKAGIILPNGKTMIEQVHAALSRVCAGVVLVGHGDGVPAVLRELPHIRDRYISRGPLGGLEALLSSGLAEEYLITPCDLPWISADIFLYLTSRDVSAPAILTRGDKPEPLIGRYSVRQLSLVRRLIRERKLAMRQLVDSVRMRKINLPEHYHFAIHNVNRKEDLSTLSI